MSDVNDKTAVADEPTAKPTVRPAAEPAAAQAEAITAPEAAAAEPVARRPRFATPLVARAVGVLLFVGVTLGYALWIKDGIPLDRPTSTRVEPEGPAIDESLTAAELLALGVGAIEERRFEAAEDLLNEARIRTASDDQMTRIAIFEALADNAEAAGRSQVASLHRDYVANLQLRLGSAVALFERAERHFATGKLIEARSLYARLILLADELAPEAKGYVDQARDRLADVMELRYRDLVPSAAQLATEPESYFADAD